MFDKIVCATDGSEHADRALDYAGQLAKSEGASLDVIHIIEKFGGARAAGLDQRADQPELDEKIKRQVADVGAKSGVETRLHLESTLGSTAKRIAELSRDGDADLIVVGTRGHSAVAGALLGSVTQQLLHVADCPVLVVPPLAQSRPRAGQADELSATS